MSTVEVDILNPKAEKLLQSLEDLKLISIRSSKTSGFVKMVQKLRKKAKGNAPSLAEITKEVESIRESRYARKKR